jgi:pyrimidine deaminase RibD-like protein
MLSNDLNRMEQAIDLAKTCHPADLKRTPRVGAVIDVGGKVYVGQRGEDDHAEKIALARVAEAGMGSLLQDATVYTTLEPCTKHVRRKPRESCTERLIDAKVKRVVIGILDPNQGVCGKGVLELQHHNIEVALFPHGLADQIRDINREFINAQQDLGLNIIDPTPGQRLTAARSGGGHPIARFKLIGEFVNDPGQDIRIIVKRGGEWWPQMTQFRQVGSSDRWEADLQLGASGEQDIHVVRVNDLGAHFFAFRERVIADNQRRREELQANRVPGDVLAKLPPDWLGIPMPSLPKGIDTQGHVTVTIEWPA